MDYREMLQKLLAIEGKSYGVKTGGKGAFRRNLVWKS